MESQFHNISYYNEIMGMFSCIPCQIMSIVPEGIFFIITSQLIAARSIVLGLLAPDTRKIRLPLSSLIAQILSVFMICLSLLIHMALLVIDNA